MAVRKPAVLVVDDDQPILSLMRSLLREFGFEPLVASSGTQALQQARARTPDVILLDRKMPGMSGVELIAELRKEETLRATPVVIVSGEPMTEAELRALGASAAVLKPFDVTELVSLVQDLAGAER